MLNVISLGAGVQSTTMALMAAHGEITPMPDCAIFADTQAEPQAVYDHLRWLQSPNVLPFPVYVVTAGNLANDIGTTNENRKYLRSLIPAFVRSKDGIDGLITRQCTRDYKITPIQKKIRSIVGYTKKRAPKTPIVTTWIGISLDEASRMKPSQQAWIENRWPLIELRMSRGDCLEWIRKRNYPKPPKSACVFCPFHSDAQWRSLSPDEFQQAVNIDERIRNGKFAPKGDLYLHRSCKPLAEVDLSTLKDRGQLNLFNNECEGMCGV